MTGGSGATSAIKLDEVSLARAAARWGAFFASLEEDECELLDRFALGDNLKSVCFELGLSYDAIRKRLIRRQDALGLPSTATFLHFWMTVRGLGRTAADPTMLRYAELLRASLGYAPSMVLPSPDPSPVTLHLQTRRWRPTPSATSRERSDAELLTLSLLSTSTWHAVLVVATNESRSDQPPPHVMVQHELFQRVVFTHSPRPLSRQLSDAVTHLLDAGSGSWTHAILSLGTTQSSLLTPATDLPWHCPAGGLTLPDATCDGAFDSYRDFKFASEFCAALSQNQTADLQRHLSQVDDGIVYGPLTGLALSVAFFRSTSPGLRATISPVLNRVISCRAHLAESISIHPIRLVESVALIECGVSVSHDRYLLSGDEKLVALAAEQLLQEVRNLSTSSSAKPVSR